MTMIGGTLTVIAIAVLFRNIYHIR